MYKLETVDPGALAARVADAAPYRPLRAKIKLIWACNLKCGFCSQWRVEGKPPPRPTVLNEARLTALLDDLAALGCERVHLSGGEPLLKPDLPRWVGEVTRRGMACSLTSNGTLWTPAKAEALIGAGLGTVTVSIDAPLPEVHDAMRGQPLWHATVAGVKAARKASKRLGIRLKIRTNTVVSRLNWRTLADYPDFAASIGVKKLALLPIDERDGHGASPARLDASEIARWNAEVAPRFAERALALGLITDEAQAYPFGREPAEIALSAAGHYARGFYREGRCYAPWLHTVVSADGLVYGCCQMKGEKRPLGSLAEAGFRAIWQGEAYRAFRAELAVARPPVCHRCDDFLPENRALDARVRACGG